MGSPVPGSSAIVGPDGRVLSKPDSPTETLIIADLDLSLVTKTKTFADAAGHCMSNLVASKFCRSANNGADSRPDMLWLGYDDRTKRISNRSD
jgi:nitrilase